MPPAAHCSVRTDTTLFLLQVHPISEMASKKSQIARGERGVGLRHHLHVSRRRRISRQKSAHAVPLASARQRPENQKGNQAGHSTERAVEVEGQGGNDVHCLPVIKSARGTPWAAKLGGFVSLRIPKKELGRDHSSAGS